MGHSLKECDFVSDEVKQLSEDDLPYSAAIKAESTILGKVNLKLANKGKKNLRVSIIILDIVMIPNSCLVMDIFQNFLVLNPI